jgi:hypothetical protein
MGNNCGNKKSVPITRSKNDDRQADVSLDQLQSEKTVNISEGSKTEFSTSTKNNDSSLKDTKTDL